jgi:hypothetical protein
MADTARQDAVDFHDNFEDNYDLTPGSGGDHNLYQRMV